MPGVSPSSLYRQDGYAWAKQQAEGRRSPKPHLRAMDAQLPDDCPYLVEHVCPYDPKRDKAPRNDIWPPGVAAALNAVLDRNYEIIRTGPRSRGPRRGSEWSR